MKIVYPNAREVHFNYAAGADDNLSRVTAVASALSGGTDFAKYDYLGAGGIVKVDYTEPDLILNFAKGTGTGIDPLDSASGGGLDRFGRVVDLQWLDYAPNPDVPIEQVKHGYDRASNRLWREVVVSAGLSPAKHFDELYTYDALYQLKTFARGNLNGTLNGIVSGTKRMAHDWTFDNTGNWTNFKEDANGDGSFELQQTRTHNKANEIGVIGATLGANWVDPVHDKAGNMTTMPRPTGGPTLAATCVYDAWNRLVRVKDHTNKRLGEFTFDGLGRRAKAVKFANDVATETRHFYYSAAWQILEERLGTSPDTANPQRQFVWGIRYIDDLILRDRDATVPANGTLEERLYALQDANWNVTALCELDGDVVERYAYKAYGDFYIFNGNYAGISHSNFDWETRFAGYRWDESVGLYQVRNRWLHSLLGRWLTRDPLLSQDGTLLYGYGAGNPPSIVDPTGYFTIYVHGVSMNANPWAGFRGVAEPEAFRVRGPDPRRYGDEFAIDLEWAYPGDGDAPYKNPVFAASDNVGDRRTAGTGITKSGMSKQHWQAMDKLRALMFRLKALIGQHECLKDEVINIVAYSQGTVITLAALQKGGIKADRVIFMGSPLDKEIIDENTRFLRTDFRKAAKNTGHLYNMWAKSDWVVNFKGGIGHSGLPESVIGGNVSDIQLPGKIFRGPSHTGNLRNASWYSGEWLKDKEHTSKACHALHGVLYQCPPRRCPPGVEAELDRIKHEAFQYMK